MRYTAQPRAKYLLLRCSALSYMSGGTKIRNMYQPIKY
uniref:Uncharacterized protein n=1 Tax=Myoviridae sp. ctgpD8 TaxID=2825149 RepID=A0A8S5QI96_9CAUD|nr:MAG TPA: hypothetical protein [Myoviridae sp. ctgpD8]